MSDPASLETGRPARRPIVEAAVLAALLLAGAVFQRTRGGLELLYLVLPLVLAGTFFRRLLAARERAAPVPALACGLELASFLGLATTPFSVYGLAAAALASAIGGGRRGPELPANGFERVAVALAGGAAILLGAARATSGDLEALFLLFVLSILAGETWYPGSARTSDAAVRRLGAFAVVLAASVTNRWDAHLEPPHARQVLLAVALVHVAAALAAFVGPREASRAPRRRFAVAGILVALLAALELIARLAHGRVVPRAADDGLRTLLGDARPGATSFASFRPHPYTCFDLEPALERNGVAWHTREGLRPPEVSRDKPPGTVRVAITGGTTAYEGDRPVEETWAAYLEEHLRGRFPGTRIEVLNAAVASHNSADTFARFHGRVLDFAPDVVLDCDGLDDVWTMLSNDVFENDLRHARKVLRRPRPPGRALSWLCRGSALARLAYFELVLGGRVPTIDDLTYRSVEPSEDRYRAHPSALARNLEDMAFICRGRGIDLVLSTEPVAEARPDEPPAARLARRAAADLHGTVRDVAGRLGLALLDLDRSFPRGEPDLFAEPRRTTVRGNRVKANLAGDALAPILERRLGANARPFALDVAPTPDGRYPPARLVR